MKFTSKQTLLCILLISALNAIAPHFHYINTNGQTFMNGDLNVFPHTHDLAGNVTLSKMAAYQQPQYVAGGGSTFDIIEEDLYNVDDHKHPYQPQASQPTTSQASQSTTSQASQSTTSQASQSTPFNTGTNRHFHYLTLQGDRTYTNQDLNTIPHIHYTNPNTPQIQQSGLAFENPLDEDIYSNIDTHTHPYYPKSK